MGANIQHESDRKKFTLNVLQDLAALQKMLDEDMFESGVTRLGAEQELCLIDDSWNAAPLAMEVLAQLDGDPLIVNEFARFNLEINADPQVVGGDCFKRLQAQIQEKLDKISAVARPLGADVLLAGILPTLRQRDVTPENMTPLPRYAQLDTQLRRMRGRDFTFSINGTDELLTCHDSALLESCNTSYQMHLQVRPEEFADTYNFAQLISAPLLAGCANSSLFFGKRLWKETRIALFQQSIDTRQGAQSIRDQSPRVTFGKDWLKDSVIEAFQDDLARFRMLIHPNIDENSLEMLAAGEIPKLRSLCLFNGTVYRWNRACYGVGGGKPHLRIECRVLPAGPTVVDEMANTAFWLGMLLGMPERYRKLHEKMPFDLAHFNFYKAAKVGLDSQFQWLDERTVTAQELILDELLPIAETGLRQAGVAEEDLTHLLGIVGKRVKQRHTGAMWMYESFNQLIKVGTRYEAAVSLTAAMAHNQREGRPVHEWTLASTKKAEPWLRKYMRIEQVMTTDLYTVNENDLVDLAAHIMEWKRIRHVPVENDKGQLVGLLTARSMMRRFSLGKAEAGLCQVSEIMATNPVTISPGATTLEALDLMQTRHVSCLPVIENDRLVGMITEYDFTSITANLLRELSDKSGQWSQSTPFEET